MPSFYEELNQSIGGDVAEQLRSRYQLDPEQARGALEAVGPLVLGGLKRQKDEGGEGRIGDLLDRHGDAEALGDLRGYFDRQDDSGAEARIGDLLGDKGGEAGQMLEQKLGLSPGMGAKLIPMLAPLVLGMLLKKGKSDGGATGGLGSIAGMLDQDGDGDILDDLGGLLAKGGAGLAGAAGGAAKSGCLGMLLGGGRR